jgi:hypothetical protein
MNKRSGANTCHAMHCGYVHRCCMSWDLRWLGVVLRSKTWPKLQSSDVRRRHTSISRGPDTKHRTAQNAICFTVDAQFTMDDAEDDYQGRRGILTTIKVNSDLPPRSLLATERRDSTSADLRHRMPSYTPST